MTMTMTTTVRGLVRSTLLLACLALLPAASVPAFGNTQERSSEPAQAAPDDKSPGAELAKETREAVGEEEENGNLKHSASIRYLAKKTGLTVHQAHLLTVGLNFLIIAFLIYWYGRKFVPAALRGRTELIQRALEEGRAASQDANRRLAEIEARLSKLDVEIGQMQASAAKEAEGEEARIQKAAEEDIRKVVQAAEQEIASAAKQARRELLQHTADLAVALARKQIQVDSATDQVLVRNFAGKLSSGSGGKDRQ
jgi:F-type H+-transporting ATPase subunit b